MLPRLKRTIEEEESTAMTFLQPNCLRQETERSKKVSENSNGEHCRNCKSHDFCSK